MDYLGQYFDRILHVDLETASPVDLKAAGMYRYAEEARILIFAYAYDDWPLDVVECVDVANGQGVPLDVMFDLDDPKVLKVAHNAGFERCVLTAVHHRPHPPGQWLCTAACAAYAGLPRGLSMAAMRAGITHKAAGIALIKRFCGAQPPKEGFAGEKWEEFKAYSRTDVQVERELHEWLKDYPMPESEREVWIVDQEINDRGFRIDVPLVEGAIKMAAEHRAVCLEEAGRLTGLENPNSVAQLKEWLALPETATLNKEAVKGLLEHSTDETVVRVLELRQQLAKSSVSKYEAMKAMVCRDGRVRGSMLYYGASTGRWAGRGLQPHNLPRVSIGEEQEPLARAMVTAGDPLTDLTFGSIPHLLSALLRTTILPGQPGGLLRVDDYSQIEARVCAWLAEEKWILDVFNTGKPYYESTAAMLYKVPLEQVTKDLRQKGKAAALALQYQGGVGALERVGGIKGTQEEKQDIVNRWRAACPAIVKLWYRLLEASVQTVREKKGGRVGRLTMRFDRGCLFIGLPSGRDLIYRDARIGAGRFGGEVVKHVDANGIEQELSPGILTENVTQAIARDCLAWELVKPEVRSTCVLHVHDEEVLEGPQVPFTQPPWADGLPIEGAGFECSFYRKG